MSCLDGASESQMAKSSTKPAKEVAAEDTAPIGARSNALYFPYISVPDEAWTFQTLLYWDKVASIVPMDHLHDPEQLSPFMRDLVREGLVRQVVPGFHLGGVPGFSSSFEQLIRARMRHRITRAWPRVRIHMEKMRDIPDVLVELGVAERAMGPWYDVEEPTANLLMAYIATCLGALPDINAAPVTHNIRYTTVFGDRPAFRKMDSTHRAKARSVILRALLPRPAEKVTLDQIVRFKERHGNLLSKFRLLVETRSAEIARIADADERAQATRLFIQSCKTEADEIANVMRTPWKKVVFGSMMPLFGSGIALQSADLGNKILYAGAALSFAGAAYQAIATIQANRAQLLRRPLAYVAHVRRI
jgi:hypothetical protein